MLCPYCEKPLECDHCATAFKPATAEVLEALSYLDQEIACPECEQVLVCHWCKTPFDGLLESGDSPTD